MFTSEIQCVENSCIAYGFPKGVYGDSGSADACIPGIGLTTNSDPACALQCGPGYSGMPRELVCASDAVQDAVALSNISCTPNACAATEVSHSDKAGAGVMEGVTGAEVVVACDAGYSSTSNVSICQTSGTFSLVACTANPCVVNTPSNGAINTSNCTHTLRSGSTCVPTCDLGYRVSGVTECFAGSLASVAQCVENSCAA